MKYKIDHHLPGSRLILPFILLFILITQTSCSYIVATYLRNFTNEIAVVDVFFLNKSLEHKHIDSVKAANSIIDFDSDYDKSFNNNRKVLWIDENHMRFELHPNTTASLWDADATISDYAPKNFTVILTRSIQSDTLANGATGYINNDLKANIPKKKRGWFRLPNCFYYDIKNRL